MSNTPPYRSLAVANWFIKNLSAITPLKLQKLIYYAHGWHLAIWGSPLIDELVEAWDYGPVIPNVYHEFKTFGNHPISGLGTLWERSDDKKTRIIKPEIPQDAENAKKLLKRIVEVYGNFSAAQLSTMTHQPGSPWDQIRKSNPDRKGVDIPDHLIKQYFKERIVKS